LIPRENTSQTFAQSVRRHHQPAMAAKISRSTPAINGNLVAQKQSLRDAVLEEECALNIHANINCC